MGSVRVLMIDDHATFREAARAVVAATNGFETVGEASTAEEGIAAAIRLRPDLVLLDVMMPGMDGYEAARQIAPALPDTVICLLSAADGAIQGEFAARCGASAFVRKQELCPGVLESVWEAHARALGR